MESKNLSNVVYENLKKDIVELRLTPGTFLLERELSERLGVSRTPVREAIKRLTQEGWLVAADRRRPAVKGFSIEEGRALFQFRHMAESFALRWSFENGMARVLAGQLDLRLRKMLEAREDSIRFLRSDIQFHTTIVETVGNEYLSRAWSTVGEEIVRISIYSMDYARTIEAITEEHESLVTSLWENRKEEALETLRGHHDKIFAGLERQLASPETGQRPDGLE